MSDLRVSLTCDALIPGCPDCAAEQVYRDSIGHDCQHHHEHLRTMCQVMGEARRQDEEFHRLSHEPELCENCQEPIHDRVGLNNTVQKLCPAGCCLHVVCKVCGSDWASYGPIDCPYCGSLGRHPRISRMRGLYRVKRRRW